MKCEDVQSKWELYINGKCQPEDEHEMEEHLQTCPQCEQLLNESLESQQKTLQAQGTLSEEDPLANLPLKVQNLLIRKAKWKNRIKNALTVFGIVFIGAIIFTLITFGYYLIGGEHSVYSKARQALKFGTEMTMPNVHINGTGLSTKVFFNADFQADMEKDLGNESKAIGEVNGKLFFNRMTIIRDWVKGEYVDKLRFLYPNTQEQPANYLEISNSAWRALEILPEGTVSELAISFDNFYTINDVHELLSDYDLHIPWYAINTGKEDQYGEYISRDNGLWGIYEHPIYDVAKDSVTYKSRASGKEIEGSFKKGLQVLSKNQKIARQFLWGLDEKNISIEEMATYVNENGVKSYGVVVTGPTKELLKLRENEHIRFASLGEVDFWNWYN